MIFHVDKTKCKYTLEKLTPPLLSCRRSYGTNQVVCKKPVVLPLLRHVPPDAPQRLSQFSVHTLLETTEDHFLMKSMIPNHFLQNFLHLPL